MVEVKKRRKKKSSQPLVLGRVSLIEKSLFAKHLAVMLQSGLSIVEALSIAESSAREKLRGIIKDIGLSVEAGNTLSASLTLHPKVFSGLFINAVYAGEASGTLVENLEGVAEQLEKDRALITKIRGAMLYPAIILVATFVLGMVLAFVVLPKITPLFKGLAIDLPFTTRWMIALSGFIERSGILLFFGVLGGAIGIVILARRRFSQPFTHWLLLHLPAVKRISHNSNRARFARTLGTLLKSGVNIDEALEIATNSLNNFYYRQALAKVGASIGRGTRLSDNLEESPELFPLLFTRMVQVGEESGRFEETFFYLASFYETEVDTATKSLSTVIEPLLLMVVGLGVGFLALSIITPIYSLTGNVSR